MHHSPTTITDAGPNTGSITINLDSSQHSSDDHDNADIDSSVDQYDMCIYPSSEHSFHDAMLVATLAERFGLTSLRRKSLMLPLKGRTP